MKKHIPISYARFLIGLGLLCQGILVAPEALSTEQFLQIAVNKSKIIPLRRNTDQIMVGNSDIADVQLIDPTHLFVLGHNLGSTSITLSNIASGYQQTLDIEVTHDIEGLKAKLYQLLPDEQPAVFSSQGSIVLSGQVSSPEKMDAILAIANTFVRPNTQSQGQQANQGSAQTSTINLNVGGDGGQDQSSQMGQDSGSQAGGGNSAGNKGGSVINMMQVGGPQQVMLEVKVAEMNRTLAKNLKVDFNVMNTGTSAGGAISGQANVPTPITDFNGNVHLPTETVQNGQIFRSLLQAAPAVISPFGLFARLIGHDSQFSAVINAARNNGLVKILAEPTLTTISGQSADFLSGGEFPIPVQQNSQNGSITITYKEYGVATKFLPVVLDSGRISLKLGIEYSELVNTNTVVSTVNSTQSTFVIPALTKRRVNSSVELADGQTIGIAGLINDNMREAINKFPGLGEIPVLGQLFTSQEFLKNQTELVIFITPRLAKPMPTSNVKLPTDHFVEPNDMEYYLMGRSEALPRRRSVPATGKAGLNGTFGQQR